MDYKLRVHGVQTDSAAWKTVLQVTAPTNIPLILRHISLYSEGTTTGQDRFRFIRQTSAGTLGAAAGTAEIHVHPNRTAEALPTGLALAAGRAASAWTTEPTVYDSTLRNGDEFPGMEGAFAASRGSFTIDMYFEKYGGLFVPAGTRMGLQFRSDVADHIVNAIIGANLG
jgi:hypothetical protein